MLSSIEFCGTVSVRAQEGYEPTMEEDEKEFVLLLLVFFFLKENNIKINKILKQKILSRDTVDWVWGFLEWNKTEKKK